MSVQGRPSICPRWPRHPVTVWRCSMMDEQTVCKEDFYHPCAQTDCLCDGWILYSATVGIYVAMVVMLSCTGNHTPEWWFMTRLSQWGFFFLFFSLLGGAVISWFSNSASFLWSPPFCGALRGSRGGDTHAHDMLRLTGGIPTLTLLHRYSSFPPGSLHYSDACTRPWSRNGDRSAVRRYCLLNGGVELQKPVTTGREIDECIWHLFRITVSLVTEVWFSHTGILGEIRFSVQSFVINRFQAILVS